MTFCTNCGKKLSVGATQCESCGAGVIAIKPTPPETPSTGVISQPDELKTQIRNPGISEEYATVTGAAQPPQPPQLVVVGAQVGRVLGGRYQLDHCIGSGGMGEIYRARRLHIGDTVAVKVLRPDVVDNERSRQRFYREARAAAMLHHPNAVVIHDFGEDNDGTAYIVMELLLGRSLRQLLVNEGSISAWRCSGIIRQTCAALDAGHRNGIVHRDIKPDNIILLDSHDDADHIKILDFGIAKLADKALDTLSLEQRLTNIGTVIGTPHYMSPEQCQGDEADARSDIYSLGVVLYELLTGVAPFIAKTPTGIAIKHVTEQPRSLRELNPNLSLTVERAVLRALEKDPSARPQTALELAREFEAAVKDEPETVRLAQSREQVKPGSTTSPEEQKTDQLPRGAETGGQPEVGTPRSYETLVTPSPVGTERISPSATDQLHGFNTIEQSPAMIDLKTQTIAITEAPQPAQQPTPQAPTVIETGKPAEVVQTEPPRTDQAKTLIEAETLDPLRTNVSPRPVPSTTPAAPKKVKGEKKAQKTDPSVQPLPASPPLIFESPKASPAAKSRAPILAGIGLLVLAIAVAGVWMMTSRKSTTENNQTVAALPSPTVEATAQTSPTPGSAFPRGAAPEGMELVIGGALRIGRDVGGEENERPAHVETIKPFYLDRTEVTNEQYQKFIEQAGYAPPPSWPGGHFPEGKDQLPVTDVTWEDATAYAKWTGKRLPTEEEWEFAARGDQGKIYPWGNEWKPDAGNVKADESDQRQLAPVGQFPNGASPFGVLDLSGNAWEWTSSDYKEYPGGKISLPAGFLNLKVIRGGSYESTPQFATATLRRGWPANRNGWPKNTPPDYAKTGFRCAQDVKEE